MADAIERWHQFIESNAHPALHALLHPDVVFESPVMHTPQTGRTTTMRYLLGAVAVLGGPDFRYVGEWRNETGAILEFETRINGITVNGVDIIQWSDDRSQITRFKVMIRPLKAINLLHQKMAAMLAQFAESAPETGDQAATSAP